MKDLLRVVRFAVYVFALPLIATAAVSAHQYYLENLPIEVPSVVADAPSPAMVSGLTGSFRNHSLVVNEQGQAKGRITRANSDRSTTVLSEMKVSFVRNGEIAHLVTTDSLGAFEVNGLAEGVYSFIASGKYGFAAFGVNVVKGEAEAAVTTMEIAVVNPDFKQVREIFSEKFSSPSGTLAVDVGIGQKIAGANRVAIESGKLRGRVFNFVSGITPGQTSAYLVRGEERVAETLVDSQGNFTFDDVEPGVYEFVTAGPDGYAALSFEAVDVLEEVQIIKSVIEKQDVLAQDGALLGPDHAPAPALEVPMTDPHDQAIVAEQLDHAHHSGQGEYTGAVVGSDIACGTAAGGCCGGSGDWGGYSSGCGGGGGFGGGEWAGIAKFAILAWLLSELDFNDNDPVIPPASPFR